MGSRRVRDNSDGAVFDSVCCCFAAQTQDDHISAHFLDNWNALHVQGGNHVRDSATQARSSLYVRSKTEPLHYFHRSDAKIVANNFWSWAEYKWKSGVLW